MKLLNVHTLKGGRLMEKKSQTCSTCAYAIFDQVWGEYKCNARKVRIVTPYISTYCGLYSSKKKGVK